MRRALGWILVSISFLLPPPVWARENVVFVIDLSAAMWDEVGSGGPRIATMRSALESFLDSPELERLDPRIGLWAAGGARELVDDGTCEDSRVLVPISSFDAAGWRQVVADLEPRGSRPLARAIVDATAEVTAAGGGKVVVVTSGADACGGEVAPVLEESAKPEAPASIRVIGVGLDRETTNAATLLVPTRNVTDAASMLEALRWAVLPVTVKEPKTTVTEIFIRLGGELLREADVELRQPTGDEIVTTSLRGGTARVRIPAGRYNAEITTGDGRVIDLVGVSIPAKGGSLAIDLPPVPPVSMALRPEAPFDEATVVIDYWGAPGGNGWVVLARAGSGAEENLIRRTAAAGDGEVRVRLPGSRGPFEARYLVDLGDGTTMIAGRIQVATRPVRATIDVPETVQTRAAVTLHWHGPAHEGDHLLISLKDGPSMGHVSCLMASPEGRADITAPIIPGVYTVRYVSATGKVLARSDVEVFEVLASVTGPGTSEPEREMEVSWTGPGSPRDFISVAQVDAPPSAYIHWAPVATGTPVRIRAPRTEGSFELRYVRGSDGQILATARLEVATQPVTLEVPNEVEAGARFVVSWTGSAGKNDIVAVAELDSDDHDHLDWAYMSSGSPVELAAPFEPGIYVIRYLGGNRLDVRERRRIRVR